MSRTPWLLLLPLMSACYSAELDPAIEGVFACEITDAENPDLDCPGSLVCDGRVCVSEVPTITIVSPEDVDFGQSFTDPANVSIRFSGTGLTLGTDADNPTEGFVRLTMDDQSVDISSGTLTGGITVTQLEVSSDPGGHRISAQAFRADGTPFTNASALDTRLFWIDDGNPHVAITRPWPGQEFNLETPLVDFEIAVLNFELSVSDTEPEPGFGHAHVYYDSEFPFPACAGDADCDNAYIAVVAPSPGEGDLRITDTAAALPLSPEATATITAVLRENDHAPFSKAAEGEDLQLVLDEITINRVAMDEE